MPRGTEDFGNALYNFGNSMIDFSELAQQMVGLGLLDGLGRTVLFDTFKNGLSMWNRINTGSAIAPYLAGYEMLTGGNIFIAPYCVVLDPGVIANQTSGIAIASYLGTQKRLGIEFGCAITASMADIELELDFVPDGFSPKGMRLTLSLNTNTLTLRSAATNIALGAMLTGVINYGTRLQVKLTGDWEKGYYQRLLINEKSIPISNYPLANSAGSNIGSMAGHVYARSYGAGTSPVYVGYVRTTKDEP